MKKGKSVTIREEDHEFFREVAFKDKRKIIDIISDAAASLREKRKDAKNNGK